MKPIIFEESNATLAKDQPDYIELPVHVSPDSIVTSCWKMSFLERIKVLLTGKIWLSQMTFGQAPQPQKMDVNKPEWL